MPVTQTGHHGLSSISVGGIWGLPWAVKQALPRKEKNDGGNGNTVTTE